MTNADWASIIINGGFALFFFNKLINEDYSEYRPFVRFFDGLAFSFNFAAFLLTVWK